MRKESARGTRRSEGQRNEYQPCPGVPSIKLEARSILGQVRKVKKSGSGLGPGLEYPWLIYKPLALRVCHGNKCVDGDSLSVRIVLFFLLSHESVTNHVTILAGTGIAMEPLGGLRRVIIHSSS